MAKPPRGSDLVSVLRGLARVGSAAVDVRSQEVTRAWATSSLRPTVIEGATRLQEAVATAIQQPQTIQKNASKNASEALARMSVVTEGLRAYRSSSVKPAEEKLERMEDPMYDPSIEELNIEEMMMQEASSGSGLDALDPSGQDALGRVQEEASNIYDKARSTTEEVSKRVEEFEPLISMAKGEEKEITDDHLQVLDDKVSELQGISHGQNVIVQEETEPSHLDENIDHSASLSKSAENTREVNETADSKSEELSIENVLMEEAMSGHHDQLLSDSQKYLYGEVQGAADAVKKGVDETRDEVTQRMSEFEPFLDIAKFEEKEITQDNLQVLDDKVSELQGISHGQNIIVQEETEPSRLDENINHSASLSKSAENTREVNETADSTKSEELSIENVLMEEAMSGHHDELLSDSQKYLYGEVQGAADAVKKGVDETRDEVTQRISEFEPLLDITKSEEKEITEEHLEAISEKLSEVHSASFGHDLKIFQEVENPKSVEEVIEDIITQQTSEKEQATKTMLETEERDLSKNVAKENTEAQPEGTLEPAAESPEAVKKLDEMHDPSVELNVEEILMQEASSGSGLDALDHSGQHALGRVQEEADNILDKVSSTTEEISKRVEEFEPLISMAKDEEKEITDDHLQVLDDKVSELQGISHGQNVIVQEKTEPSHLDENINHSASLSKSAENTREVNESADSTKSQELSIENVLMGEAMSGHHDELLSDSQKYLYGEVQGAADAVKKGVDESRDEVTQRISEFEPLLDITKSEEKEITEEHLEAINEKLSEVHNASFGHDLKIFQEVENPKSVEEVIQDIVTQQTSEKEQPTKTILETEERDLAKSVPEENTKVQTEGTLEPAASNLEASKKVDRMYDSSVEKQSIEEKDEVKSVPEGNTKVQTEDTLKPATSNLEAAAELESSISQVAKPVTLDDSYSSTATEVKVDVQVDPTAGASQMERIISTGTVSEGASSSSYTSQSISPITPDGSGGAPAAVISSMAATAAVAAGASFTVGTAPAPAVAVAPAAAAAAAPAAPVKAATMAPTPSASFDSPVTRPEANTSPAKPKPKLLGKKPLAKEKPKSTLSENAQARKVPHSRFGRLVSFGGLAAGLGVGTLAEVTRRSLGLNQGKGSGSLLDASPFLTEANAKRIVDTLCRVRGAALKLGQMLSIQDSALINPQLQKIFERVRQSADFMPTWQLEEAIRSQLGEDWRSKVATFDDKPFAAASIGQVHLATLHDGRSVAMKIQYPGVAEGIESDINNLVSTLKVANIFPEGLFVDSVIEVAKRELRWECDYVRELECTKRFRELVKPYPEFYVPEVIPELCTPQIFTSELIAGMPVDKCTEIDQESRNYLSEQVLRLCLIELFQFGFMQTDPNWSNFFYNAETEQVALLDFGACREYTKDFVDKYINLIYGAAVKDREKVLKYSQELGFLTGYEAKVMVDAHIDAIMILGEAFQEDKPFVFGDQNTTHRIQNLVPVMLSHRMCAPPEESYSLHRKMSGVFLLCTKLNGKVNCYKLFHDIYRNYKFGGTWEDFHASNL